MTKSRAPMAVVSGVLAVLLLVHQSVVLPGDSQLISALRNAAHTPWFFAVTLLLWVLLRHWSNLSRGRLLIACSAGALGLALLTELIQYFTPRDADAGDVMLNLLGAASALCLVEGWHLWQIRAAGRALFSFTLALGLLMAGFYQVGYTLLAHQQRDSIAPALVDYSGKAGLYMNSLRGNWHIVHGISRWPGYRESRVAEVSLSPDRRFSGLRLREPWPDWTAYERLVMEAYLEEGSPLPLTVRVATEKNRGLRSTVNIVLAPGPNRFEIPVRSLIGDKRTAENEDGQREEGLPSVKRLLIYSDGDRVPRTFYLGKIRLE